MFAPRRFVAGLTVVVCSLLLSHFGDVAAAAGEDFDKLDINQDGRLSGTEVSAELRPFDTNGDGRVSRDEYQAGTSGATREAAEKKFNGLDINQDGVLSGTERRGVEKADADGDGEISKQEFLAGAPTPAVSRDALFREARGRFRALDASQNDLLSGTEIETVAGYDLNSDGRISLDEFFEGYEQAAGAGWTKAELAEGEVTVRLPAAPQRLPTAGPIKQHFALEIDQPAIRFEIRVSEVGSDVESKAEQFFAAVKDRFESASKMDIADEDDAPYEGHPGRIFLLEGPQNDFHALRIVLLAKRIYELEMIFNKEPGDLEEAYGRRFLERLSIADSGSSTRPTEVPPAPATPDAENRNRGPLGRLREAMLPPAPSPPSDDSSPPPAPRLLPNPLSDSSRDAPRRKEPSPAAPPNGTYTLQKISGGSLIGLGTLQLRDGTYRYGDEGEFAPFTVDAQGNIVWSAGLNFLPDGWTHDFSKYAGPDSLGRPMLKIHYHTTGGTKDIIDGIVE